MKKCDAPVMKRSVTVPVYFMLVDKPVYEFYEVVWAIDHQEQRADEGKP